MSAVSTADGHLPGSMRASVLVAANTVVVEERPVPDVPLGEVLIEVAAVGVCGSDVHYYREMRAGDFVVEAPLVLGHEVSGRIVAVGEGVAPARIGDRVAIEPQRPCHKCSQCVAGRYNLCPHMRFYATPPVDGAFTQFVTAPSMFAHTLRDGLSDDAGALMEPLSVGIAAMRKAGAQPGDRVLIAGAGPIGIITAQTARAFGAREIIVSDPSVPGASGRCGTAPRRSSTPPRRTSSRWTWASTRSSTLAARPRPSPGASARSGRPAGPSWSAWATANWRCPSRSSKTARSP